MDQTSSVSKGVFIFKNGFKLESTKKHSKSKTTGSKNNIFNSELWYQSYNELWKHLDKKIKKLNNKMFSNILSNLLVFINDCYQEIVTEVPVAAILMGINMSDHFTQFSTLSEDIISSISPHVAILEADDCNSVKSLIENMVFQFLNSDNNEDVDSEIDSKIRKSSCTLSFLHFWYNEKYMSSNTPKHSHKKQKPDVEKKNLVVIIPEFESFEPTVLQDFILIISSYLNELPFVIIFGIATSLTILQRNLPFQITAKMRIEVFSAQSSIEYLNNILNNVLLNDLCPFHLGGKTFALFTDIFLFYDFSVKNFIQNYKFAMLKHFSSHGNAIALCTKLENLSDVLKKFDHDDLESVRRLFSFRKFVESHDFPVRIKLIQDDKFFKSMLKIAIKEFHNYLFCFHVLLRCLHELVFELPGTPLGKQFREIYAIAVAKNITLTNEYKTCVQLLQFLSKDELLNKLSKIKDILKKNLDENNKIINEILGIIINFTKDLQENNLFENNQNEEKVLTENLNRAKLKEELLKMSKEKFQSKSEKIREKYFKILTDFFVIHLVNPCTKPFHEIFVFNDANSIKNNIVGSHRAAIHTALNDPHWYLQCDCCNLPNDLTIIPSLPDISIVYKLHLESGRLINMYDWLQAFVTIVDPSGKDEEEESNIDPKLQARFTRTVAELEFLGFIKSSKTKTDHVQRLTWGGY